MSIFQHYCIWHNLSGKSFHTHCLFLVHILIYTGCMFLWYRTYNSLVDILSNIVLNATKTNHSMRCTLMSWFMSITDSNWQSKVVYSSCYEAHTLKHIKNIRSSHISYNFPYKLHKIYRQEQTHPNIGYILFSCCI